MSIQEHRFNILPLSEQARNLYENHSTFHKGDCGIDLFILKDTTIEPGETVKVPLGIKTELIVGGENRSYYLYPRSSIYKTPLRLANCVGIIDSGYRGELMAIVDHIKLNDTCSYTIPAGTRLFQLCSYDLTSDNLCFSVVDILSDSDRGTAGLGSTG